jgi:hypothetical protein
MFAVLMKIIFLVRVLLTMQNVWHICVVDFKFSFQNILN